MDLNDKAELKRVWVDSLRSDEYTQCTGTLHNLDTGGSCCLGVAAKVWGLATFGEMGVSLEAGGEYEDDSEGPKHIYNRLDELVSGDRTTRNPVVRKGIEMNDEGKSFAEIADMIEREWDV